MRTIQEKYNAILEGNFSKSQFVKDAKRELSQFLSPFNGYEDTVSILKSKGVIFEAAKKRSTALRQTRTWLLYRNYRKRSRLRTRRNGTNVSRNSIRRRLR